MPRLEDVVGDLQAVEVEGLEDLISGAAAAFATPQPSRIDSTGPRGVTTVSTVKGSATPCV